MGRNCINCRKKKPGVSSCNGSCPESSSVQSVELFPAGKYTAMTLNVESETRRNVALFGAFIDV